MNRLIVTVILFFVAVFSPNIYAQDFVLSENGVTVSCSDVEAGDAGTIDGKTYTAVDREMLESKISNKDDLTAVCTSLVTDMSSLFYSNTNFNENISSWDVSNVTTMRKMFFGVGSFKQDITNWDVSNVTDMSYMFYANTGFNEKIGDWDVSSVTNMSNMFSGAYFFNQNISGWDVSNVTDMSKMFSSTYFFNQDINDWDVTSVENMSKMFSNTKMYNRTLDNWDVSNVKDMSFMFYAATAFNQDISDWDVAEVTDMYEMFFDAGKFNQDLSGWCVPLVEMEPGCFSTGSDMAEAKEPIWGTCPEKDPVSNEMDNKPNSFTLDQNYPNPFNPETNIRFAIPEAANVQLEVFNMLGQKVATLVNERKSAGTHTIRFDAAHLAGGSYVYRIEAGDFVNTKVLTLIK